MAAKEEPTDAELIDLAGELVKLDIARMENADAKKLVEKMQGEIFGRAAEPAYALGRQAHDDGDYEQAAVYLQAACDYGLRSDSCYYYLGKSYQLMEANEQAAEYYRRLLAEFPSRYHTPVSQPPRAVLKLPRTSPSKARLPSQAT